MFKFFIPLFGTECNEGREINELGKIIEVNPGVYKRRKQDATSKRWVRFREHYRKEIVVMSVIQTPFV
jgi:hypothetical protein